MTIAFNGGGFGFDFGLLFLGVSQSAGVFGADGFQVGIGKAESKNGAVSFGGQLFRLDAFLTENGGDVFRQVLI